MMILLFLLLVRQSLKGCLQTPEFLEVGSTRKAVALAYGMRCEVNVSVIEKLEFTLLLTYEIQLWHKLARLLGYAILLNMPRMLECPSHPLRQMMIVCNCYSYDAKKNWISVAVIAGKEEKEGLIVANFCKFIISLLFSFVAFNYF
nr:probable thimet oligopeptidase [Ipomoea batatas]